jgi:hypothetical protein
VEIPGQERRKALNYATQSEIVQWLRRSLCGLVGFEVEVSQSASKWLANAGGGYAAATKSVCALLVEGAPQVFTFNETGQPEEIDGANPIHSVGSGELLGQPFAQFWRRTVLQNRTPTTD